MNLVQESRGCLLSLCSFLYRELHFPSWPDAAIAHTRDRHSDYRQYAAIDLALFSPTLIAASGQQRSKRYPVKVTKRQLILTWQFASRMDFTKQPKSVQNF